MGLLNTSQVGKVLAAYRALEVFSDLFYRLLYRLLPRSMIVRFNFGITSFTVITRTADIGPDALPVGLQPRANVPRIVF